MMNRMFEMSALQQALAASFFALAMTSAGAALVFANKRSFFMNGAAPAFSYGIMVSSAFFSLLVPAMEAFPGCGSERILLPLAVLAGALLIKAFEKIKLQRILKIGKEGSLPFVLAIFLHNIPEGIAIGTAFAYAGMAESAAALKSAAVLSLGIAIQDVPEGAAVSLPLNESGKSKNEAFFWGAASALGEPLGAVLGVFLTESFKTAMPLFSAFAAGCMLYAVAGEMFAERLSRESKHSNLGFMVGFCVMMALDLAVS